MTGHDVPANLRRRAVATGMALGLAITTSASVTAAAQPVSVTAKFADNGGPVLSAAQIYIIYWGRTWTPGLSASPAASQIASAVQTVVASSYLTGLAQYRNIGPATVSRSLVVTASDPPSEFTNDHIEAFLDALFDTGALPDPDDDALYLVTIPAGIHSDANEFVGEHSYYERHGQPIRYAWTADSLSLDRATRIITHELVESLTDPQGNAILGAPGTCHQHGWCEIADICPSTGLLNGVTVASYWSNAAGECVIPVPASPREPASTDRGQPQ